MAKTQKKTLRNFLYALLGLAAIFIVLLIWLYSGSLTPAKTKIFSALPLPAASVNGHWVSMKSYILRYDLAQKLGIQQTGQTPEQIKQSIFSQLVNDTETAQLASANGVFVAQAQIDQEYDTRASSTDLQGYKSFEALVQSYGLTKSSYEDQVIKPALLTTQMEIWFNSQTNLNPNEYQLANSLVQKIQSGQDMAALAKQYSQDPTGQSVGGDLGFVNLSGLLPELQEPVDDMTIGSVKIIPSEYGLHIIRLEQKVGNLYHLREIFLNGESYSAWFTGQTKNFKVREWVKI